MSMYKDVAKNLEKFRIVLPNTIVPSPTQDDYDSGFIVRYFLRKSNDSNSQIFEVSKEVSKKYVDNPFWIGCNIRWRITGTPEQIMKSNEAAMAYVSRNFPTLPLYIPNILQFSRQQD